MYRRMIPALSIAIGLSACGSDGETNGTSSDADTESEVDAGGQVGSDAGLDGAMSLPPDRDEPLYLMQRQVFNPNGRDTFITVIKSLDAPASEFELANAREFAAIAGPQVIRGRVLVSSGEAPTITSFEIDDDRNWHEGATINFGAYPLADNANWFGQFVLNDGLVYLPFNVTGRVVWNPIDMSILADFADTTIPKPPMGMDRRFGGNGMRAMYPERVHQPFFANNGNSNGLDWDTKSYIATYDPTTHRETSSIEVPNCPEISLATRSEDGYTYFSGRDYSPAYAVWSGALPPCVVRLKPDGTLDTDWKSVTTWPEMAGKYIMNFVYSAKGKAIGNVFDPSLASLDTSVPFSRDVIRATNTAGPGWKLWLFDLAANTARPLEGVTGQVGSRANLGTVDGRSFLFAPYDMNARTKIYEIDENGVASEHLDVAGVAAFFMRIR